MSQDSQDRRTCHKTARTYMPRDRKACRRTARTAMPQDSKDRQTCHKTARTEIYATRQTAQRERGREGGGRDRDRDETESDRDRETEIISHYKEAPNQQGGCTILPTRSTPPLTYYAALTRPPRHRQTPPQRWS